MSNRRGALERMRRRSPRALFRAMRRVARHQCAYKRCPHLPSDERAALDEWYRRKGIVSLRATFACRTCGKRFDDEIDRDIHEVDAGHYPQPEEAEVAPVRVATQEPVEQESPQQSGREDGMDKCPVVPCTRPKGHSGRHNGGASPQRLGEAPKVPSMRGQAPSKRPEAPSKVPDAVRTPSSNGTGDLADLRERVTVAEAGFQIAKDMLDERRREYAAALKAELERVGV